MTTTNNSSTVATRFKIQGVGLDTSTITMKPWINEEDDHHFDYIHTSISANNDFILAEFVKNSSGASLITSIDFITNPDRALMGHLLTLDRKKIDLLLVESKVVISSLDSIKETINSLKKSGIIGELGIKNPETVEDIEKINAALEEKTKFISLDICPLHFNYEVVKYCKENNVDLLGFNPFGGNISSASVIESFTTPYLLGFSSTYCSVVFLSGRDLILSKESMKYIKDYIVGSENSSKYFLKKSVSRLYKPLKKVVETSMILNKQLVLNLNSPDYLYPLDELLINLGTPVNIVDCIDPKLRTETESIIDEVLQLTEFPEGISIQSKYAIMRYQILSTIKSKFTELEGWNINMINLGSLVTGIFMNRVVKKKTGKGFFKKKKYSEEIESKYFLCALPSIDLPVFIEDPDMKNANLENPNPNN